MAYCTNGRGVERGCRDATPNVMKLEAAVGAAAIEARIHVQEKKPNTLRERVVELHALTTLYRAWMPFAISVAFSVPTTSMSAEMNSASTFRACIIASNWS